MCEGTERVSGAPGLSTHADPDFVFVAPAPVSVHLQETKQLILHYKKCNQILLTRLGSLRNLVKKGMICGYQDGKSLCKVSSWLRCGLYGEDVPSCALPKCQGLGELLSPPFPP